MQWLISICVFIVAVIAGDALGRILPDKFVPKPLRAPLGAFLVGLGLAVVAFQFF